MGRLESRIESSVGRVGLMPIKMGRDRTYRCIFGLLAVARRMAVRVSEIAVKSRVGQRVVSEMGSHVEKEGAGRSQDRSRVHHEVGNQIRRGGQSRSHPAGHVQGQV